MKKKVLPVLMIFVCAVTCTFLLACGVGAEGNGASAVVYFMNSADNELERVEFTVQKEVMTVTEKTSLRDYLDVLVAGGKFTLEGDDSGYGYYITAVNGRAEKTLDSVAAYEGYAWSVYIDFKTLEGDSAVYASDDETLTSRTGKTLYKSSYGVSGIPCLEGHVYALVYERYSYAK